MYEFGVNKIQTNGFRRIPTLCIFSPQIKGKTMSKFLEELKLQSKQRKVLPGWFFTQDLQDDSVLNILFQNHGF